MVATSLEEFTAYDLTTILNICPVCEVMDQFEASFLEQVEYVTKDGEPHHKGTEGDIFGLLGLSCQACGFELIKRTPREALYIEEAGRKRRSAG